MLAQRKFYQQLCFQMNPISSHLNLCVNCYSSFTGNSSLTSCNSQYCQPVFTGSCYSSSKIESYSSNELLADFQASFYQNHKLHSKRYYSFCKTIRIENGFSKQCSTSQTSCRTIATAAPLPVASTIVPTVVAENHAATLNDHVTTAAIATTDAANTSDLYGWLTSYITLLESVAASAPVMQLMSLLRLAHECTGLPWWLTIVLTTVVVRTTITLPLAFYQQYVVARLELLRGEMVEVMKHLAAETRRAKQEHNWDEETANMFFRRQSRETWRGLIVRDNCHPAKGAVLVIAQLPLWILLSISHRNLALARPIPDAVAVTAHHQLAVEGLLWCPNLTLPDPMMLLPLAMGVVNLIITEVHGLQRPPATTPGMKRLTYFLRGVSVITVPIAIFMPSGVVLYWVTSSCCALSQTLLLLHPRLRGACGIPVTPSSQPHPYSGLVTTLRERLARKRGMAQLPIEVSAKEENLPNDKNTTGPKKR